MIQSFAFDLASLSKSSEILWSIHTYRLEWDDIFTVKQGKDVFNESVLKPEGIPETDLSTDFDVGCSVFHINIFHFIRHK